MIAIYRIDSKSQRINKVSNFDLQTSFRPQSLFPIIPFLILNNALEARSISIIKLNENTRRDDVTQRESNPFSRIISLFMLNLFSNEKLN